MSRLMLSCTFSLTMSPAARKNALPAQEVPSTDQAALRTFKEKLRPAFMYLCPGSQWFYEEPDVVACLDDEQVTPRSTHHAAQYYPVPLNASMGRLPLVGGGCRTPVKLCMRSRSPWSATSCPIPQLLRTMWGHQWSRWRGRQPVSTKRHSKQESLLNHTAASRVVQ